MTPTIDLTAVRKAFLERHNAYRATHHSPALAQKATLDATAQSWAEHLASIDDLAHSRTRGVGENLYLSADVTTDALDPDALAKNAVKAWYDEVAAYNYATGRGTDVTGHFTQVVWKSTTHLGTGCVITTRPHRDGVFVGIYVVCQYSPPGNMNRAYLTNVLKP